MNQVNEYLDRNNLVPDDHHGGRKGHGTTSALCCLNKNIAKCVEESDTTMVLTTDLTAAFDLIDHQILIEKLKYLGFEEDALDLMKSFLKDRNFFVDDVFSVL